MVKVLTYYINHDDVDDVTYTSRINRISCKLRRYASSSNRNVFSLFLKLVSDMSVVLAEIAWQLGKPFQTTDPRTEKLPLAMSCSLQVYNAVRRLLCAFV